MMKKFLFAAVLSLGIVSFAEDNVAWDLEAVRNGGANSCIALDEAEVGAKVTLSRREKFTEGLTFYWPAAADMEKYDTLVVRMKPEAGSESALKTIRVCVYGKKGWGYSFFDAQKQEDGTYLLKWNYAKNAPKGNFKFNPRDMQRVTLVFNYAVIGENEKKTFDLLSVESASEAFPPAAATTEAAPVKTETPAPAAK